MLITYDFVCSEKYMYVFTFLSSFFMISGQLYHAESFDYAPSKICNLNCIFNEKLILIIMRVMSLTLIHIYSHMHIDTWTLQQREWFSSWPCGCKKESWSSVTHIDWRGCFGGRLSPFPLLSCLPRLPLAFYFRHLSAEISAVIRAWDWWQSQHAPCYII